MPWTAWGHPPARSLGPVCRLWAASAQDVPAEAAQHQQAPAAAAVAAAARRRPRACFPATAFLTNSTR